MILIIMKDKAGMVTEGTMEMGVSMAMGVITMAVENVLIPLCSTIACSPI